ncbi:unnamed protein product [Amoebophrya sp. A120]|nr:unnamed protein product [Amoebophrya sp. A120]|eukprot:GSA120T00019428001.1
MDIESLRKNPTANQRRIGELKKQQRDLFREQRTVAQEWNKALEPENKVQTSNIRRMRVAVFLSTQPGQIEYGQTPPDLSQASRYRRRTTQIEQLQKQIEGCTEEIKRLENEERKQNAEKASGTKMGSIQEWNRAYGMAKRTMSKTERWLSYVKPPSQIISGAESKDGTVKFPGSLSQALPMRRGMLTD